MSDNMDGKEKKEQTIMVDGVVKTIKVVLDQLLHKKDGVKRVFSEG
jgi:hypothetical protein